MIGIYGEEEIQSTNCVFDLSEFLIGTSIFIKYFNINSILIEVPIKNKDQKHS